MGGGFTLGGSTAQPGRQRPAAAHRLRLGCGQGPDGPPGLQRGEQGRRCEGGRTAGDEACVAGTACSGQSRTLAYKAGTKAAEKGCCTDRSARCCYAVPYAVPTGRSVCPVWLPGTSSLHGLCSQAAAHSTKHTGRPKSNPTCSP
jgi:uncharacterized membrane protein